MWLPSTQSWATCEYASTRLSSPMRVSPRPETVPRLTVTYSRKVLRAPIVRARRLAPVLHVPRRLADGGELVDAVALAHDGGPLMTACGPIQHPAPMVTSGPMTAKGPTARQAQPAPAATQRRADRYSRNLPARRSDLVQRRGVFRVREQHHLRLRGLRLRRRQAVVASFQMPFMLRRTFAGRGPAGRPAPPVDGSGNSSMPAK